jgi:hypothetical protein
MVDSGNTDVLSGVKVSDPVKGDVIENALVSEYATELLVSARDGENRPVGSNLADTVNLFVEFR